MKLIGDRILVEKLAEDKKTEGGIILPKEQHKDNDCRVLMVGPKVEHINVGDKIMRIPYAGVPKMHEGKSCLFLRESEDVEFVY